MTHKLTNRPFLKYTIIGNGRLARHMRHYFSLLNLPMNQWSRSEASESELSSCLAESSHVLLLIRDSAIEDFIQSHPILSNHTLIHCSGALSSVLAYSAHPLLAFGPNLYDRPMYEQISFFIESNGPSSDELLPGLQNSFYRISSEKKALYHALCVLSGNFTTMLWQKLFEEFETQFQVPKATAFPYLQSISENLQKNATQALTGPLARADEITIAKNLAALQGDPFQRVYQAFLTSYREKMNVVL